MPKKPYKEYALYRNDEFVMIGNAYELAERMGCTVDTVRWHTYPSGIKRLLKRKRGGWWVERLEGCE